MLTRIVNPAVRRTRGSRLTLEIQRTFSSGARRKTWVYAANDPGGQDAQVSLLIYTGSKAAHLNMLKVW